MALDSTLNDQLSSEIYRYFLGRVVSQTERRRRRQRQNTFIRWFGNENCQNDLHVRAHDVGDDSKKQTKGNTIKYRQWINNNKFIIKQKQNRGNRNGAGAGIEYWAVAACVTARRKIGTISMCFGWKSWYLIFMNACGRVWWRRTDDDWRKGTTAWKIQFAFFFFFIIFVSGDFSSFKYAYVVHLGNYILVSLCRNQMRIYYSHHRFS